MLGGSRPRSPILLSHLSVGDDGLRFRSDPEDADRVVDLLLDGRRIWSFRVAEVPSEPADGEEPREAAGRRHLAWPAVLRPYLHGVATFGLRGVHGGTDCPSTTGRLGNSDEPLRFADRYGMGLVVNKFGGIGHALADYDPGMVQRLLDNVDRVRAVLAEHTELPVYVMSGTLLGPYRDGRIMPHDDDADLGYLSGHSHPTEVVREAFVVGRLLRAAGLDVQRASAGHVQIHFTHEGRPDAYVDVFTGWIDADGWWQHTFAIRTRARREQVVPPIMIDVEGRPEPAPREPEVMLEANYGPGWKIPDPAYRFDIPQATQDRFYGWFADFDMDRPPWEDHYRYDLAGDRVPLGSAPSDYARWLADRLPPAAPVVELGSGRGHDALWLAGRGHRVDAVDYARLPTRRAQETAEEQQLPATLRVLNLYDLRRVLAFGAELAGRGEPPVVYARGLLGSLWETGRPHLFRLLSMLLRGGGTAHLDVPRRDLMPEYGTGIPVHRGVAVATLTAELARFGLHVDESHEAAEVVEHMPWETAGTPVPTTRMVVSWRRATR